MIEELSEEYIPQEILHRDEQLAKIREVFNNFKKYKSGTNLVLFGVTGSGKTTIVKKICREENNSVYISCDRTLTCFKTLKELFGVKAYPKSELLEKIITQLREKPRIIVIDEIDKIRDFSNMMNILNTIYRKTMVPIILITLKRDLVSVMKSDVRKTLLFEKVNLPSYNAFELQDILRARIINLKTNFSEHAIGYISAFAAQQGSARILMNITLRCLQKNNFTNDFIEETYKQLMRDDWMDFINDINETEKEFLKLLVLSCDDEKEVASETLEKELGMSGGRISQLLNDFEKYGVVVTHHENRGRAGGRKRLIKFKSKEVYDELSGD